MCMRTYGEDTNAANHGCVLGGGEGIVGRSKEALGRARSSPATGNTLGRHYEDVVCVSEEVDSGRTGSVRDRGCGLMMDWMA